MRVLYVCTANVCRSPFMELWSSSRVAAVGVDPQDLSFSSAGTRARPDEAVAPEIRDVLLADGVADADVRAHRSRALTPDLLDAADLVLVATREHRARILADHPAAFRRVLTLGQAATAADTVAPLFAGRRAEGEMVTALGAHRGNADPADDVQDPFGRGAAAARVCAATVTGLLAPLLDLLTDGANAPSDDLET